MSEINLLPWREVKREREKKEFTVYLAASVIVAVAVVFLTNTYANNLIKVQTQKNQILQTEIAQLKRQIAEIAELKPLRAVLIERMNIIQNLQAARSLTVRLFDELIKVMPNGVYLIKVERAEDKITVLGFAESNTNISQLMRNIERNQWIQSPDLTEIKKTQETASTVENEFKLSFILSPLTNDSNEYYKP